jgi:hypothetical protein
MKEVYIVLEGPDMTYYGDAEIHGVFTDREAAEAKASGLSGYTGDEWGTVTVQAWDVKEPSGDG